MADPSDSQGSGEDAFDNLADADTIPSFRKSQKPFGDRYELRELLGSGGMGVVWRAYDSNLRRDFALKFLTQLITRDTEASVDLEREARSCIDLIHPNIVRVYDFIASSQTSAIKMEFIKGDDLSRLKVRQPCGCFNVSFIREPIRQCIEALEYAHTTARIIHRDIKPKNLILSDSGILKVMDFGISQSLNESVSRVTSRPSGGGSWPYMSPQQVEGERGTVTDDVYSLGATIYELLTGKPPFFGGDLTFQIRNKTPVPMMKRRSDLLEARRGLKQEDIEALEPIPPLWDQVVQQCLAKDPEERPQSPIEIAQMLGLLPGGAEPASVAKFLPSAAAAVAAPIESKGRIAAPSASVPPATIATKKPATSEVLIAALILGAAALIFVGVAAWRFTGTPHVVLASGGNSANRDLLPTITPSPSRSPAPSPTIVEPTPTAVAVSVAIPLTTPMPTPLPTVAPTPGSQTPATSTPSLAPNPIESPTPTRSRRIEPTPRPTSPVVTPSPVPKPTKKGGLTPATEIDWGTKRSNETETSDSEKKRDELNKKPGF